MNKNQIAQQCAKLEIRVQNLYRKLFFGMQDHTVSPELRQCAVELRKCAEAGNYPEALENAKKVSYLLDVTHENRLVIDQVYESIKADAEEVIATLADADAADSDAPDADAADANTADANTADADNDAETADPDADAETVDAEASDSETPDADAADPAGQE